jgi:hypothetical protein
MVTLSGGAAPEGDWWAAGRPLPQSRPKQPKKPKAAAAAVGSPLVAGNEDADEKRASAASSDDETNPKADPFQADDALRKAEDQRNGLDHDAPFRHEDEQVRRETRNALGRVSFHNPL